jgi:hypothetical protein
MKLKPRSASSLVEVLVGMALLIPLCLVGFDLIIVLAGYLVNASVCREAARAASIGAPNSIEKGGPQARALRAVKSAEIPRGIVRIVKVDVNEQIKPSPDADVFGGLIDGQVSVCTRAVITPPFLLPSVLRRRTVEVMSSQTYPYTWRAVPNSIGQQKPPLPPPPPPPPPPAIPKP